MTNKEKIMNHLAEASVRAIEEEATSSKEEQEFWDEMTITIGKYIGIIRKMEENKK